MEFWIVGGDGEGAVVVEFKGAEDGMGVGQVGI